MRKLMFAVTAATALAACGALMSRPAEAAVIGPSSDYRAAVDGFNMLQNAQFFHEGRQHCWYNNGWRGPGWYWCGYAFRRGLGWGGEEGWRGWERRREERAFRQPRYNTWNGCPPRYTIQDGVCKPYRGY